jgi:hypothetical protein
MTDDSITHITHTSQTSAATMAAAARRLTEAVKLLLCEDYAKLDKRVPHLLDRLRERGADYCWHKARRAGTGYHGRGWEGEAEGACMMYSHHMPVYT